VGIFGPLGSTENFEAHQDIKALATFDDLSNSDNTDPKNIQIIAIVQKIMRYIGCVLLRGAK
jgi:hypothetical protein